jgi:flagellar biosynthesis/type III secretory pathway ATPase
MIKLKSLLTENTIDVEPIIKQLFDRKNYFDFHSRVTAKTSGANVHVVNGLLGNVLNGCPLVMHFANKGDAANVTKWTERVKEALKQIKVKTGISP